MLDKLTENMKFLIMLIIYTGTMAWWASGITINVATNSEHITETLELVKGHNVKCERLNIMEYKLQAQSIQVNKLQDIIYALEHKENTAHGRTKTR